MISFPEILLRLAVALLLGAVVGFEREQKEHAAGLCYTVRKALSSNVHSSLRSNNYDQLTSINPPLRH